MRKLLLIGNPNVGKTTLFNSLTKSHEHTGNFHGVTVEEKGKLVNLDGEGWYIVDLPGLYSLLPFSFEEEISKNAILNNKDLNLVVCDASSLRRNLYLCLQLKELNINFKILINNYSYFKKHNNSINISELNRFFDAEIVDAKKCRFDKNFLKFKKIGLNLTYLAQILAKIKEKIKKSDSEIIAALNGNFAGFNPQETDIIKAELPALIQARYNFIDSIIKSVVVLNKNYVYGKSKLDKILLKPPIMFAGFLAVFFASIYFIFFLIGPFLSDTLVGILNFLLISPINNFLYSAANNIWIIQFFSEGVFSSINTVLTFLPQVCLLFLFLTILEDSGLISRMAYVMDDFLTKLGLNGKAIYIILMGLGCNTMSTLISRNMSEKNLKIKCALINPFVSCMARLPVYVLVASAFFGNLTYFVVVGLYLLGLLIALIMALILNKTILKTKSNNMLLEFPPLRNLDIKHIGVVVKTNAVDFTKRVFGVVVSVGVIVWILTHTNFKFAYTQQISESIMFFLADKIAPLFAPIGLNSAGVVCALIVGIMAKELVVSTLSITNNAQTNSALISSLTLAASPVHFTSASAVSFLVFILLYCPCISNIAVLRKEVGGFYTAFSIVSQLTIAYLTSFVFYQSILHGIKFAAIALIIIFVILLSIIYLTKRIKQHKCLTCNKCKR